jgi:hypothetical protein
MANYALKYYKDITQPDGTEVRLEIHQKTDGIIRPESMEIGEVLKGLSLQMQGQQGDIDAPIVKTSLSITLVDAPDLAQARDASLITNFKTGNWDEFYTADATKWKVILKTKGLSGLYSTEWGGYITPDSFSEDLAYRGSVSITARDNLGHMQDFPVEKGIGYLDGTITLGDLIGAGFGKIESPMTLSFGGYGSGINWLTSNGVPLHNVRMNLSFFDGMNYYEAIEKALYSAGCVMRYVGRNKILVCPLRDMPKHGLTDYDSVAVRTPIFKAGARRELSPAVKTIKEEVKFDLKNDVPQPQVEASNFTGTQSTYKCEIEGGNESGTNWGQVEHDAPVWSIGMNSENWSEGDKTLFFDLSQYETGYFTSRAMKDGDMRKYMYLAANNTDEREARFERRINLSDFSIRMKFGQPVSLNSADKLEMQSAFNLKRLTYSVIVKQNGTSYYYAGAGEWATTKKRIIASFSPSDSVTEWKESIYLNDTLIENMAGDEWLTFVIYKIEYAQMGYASTQKKGLYACIQELAIGIPDTKPMREKNTIQTIYNEGNNVVLSRDPELAPAYDAVFITGCIKNGMFVTRSEAKIPAPEWSYNGSDPAQLGVHIHKMLLCYHSKPNNIITGTLVNADFGSFSCNWLWRAKEHILTSGTLNLLTQQMEGATLREFIRYEDMWNNEGGEAGGTPEIKPENPPIIG